MRYERILAAVAATPWAIEPNKGRELAAILNRRVAGGRATADELAVVAAVREDRQRKKAKPSPAGLALIPLYGVLVQKADLMMEVSGLLSADQIGRMVDSCADDPSCEAIVIDCDSPGGSVFGIPELAAKVAAAARRKKVIAVVNSMCASAAYYVASQASEIVISPGGMCGSIGVVMMHCDETKALEMGGQVVTVIASTDKKAGGVDPGPLSPAWRAELEGIVAGYYDQFVRAVAKGRGVSAQRVQQDFGGGGVLLAHKAVHVGMCDRVGSLDGVLGEHGLRFSVDGETLLPTAAVSRPNPTASRHVVLSRDPEIRKRQLILASEDATASRRKIMADDEARERAASAKAKAVAGNAHRRALLLADDAPAARTVNGAPVRPAAVHAPVTAELRLIAYHEAGHTLLAALAGDTEVSATVVPSSDPVSAYRGCCFQRLALPWQQQSEVYYGGYLAEGYCPDFRTACVAGYSGSSDDAEALKLLGNIPPLVEQAKKHAAQKLGANSFRLRALAALLIEKRTVTAADVRHVLATVGPN